jgi:DNA-binding NarL/FixJ family response regulator
LDHPDTDQVAEADMHAVRRAAQALAGQTGTGVARATLVALPGTANSRLTLFAPEPDTGTPVIAVMRPAAPGAHPAFRTLTARERQVAALLGAGWSNRQIAQALVVTVATVKDHVHHILTKTGLASRAAVAAAWRATDDQIG